MHRRTPRLGRKTATLACAATLALMASACAGGDGGGGTGAGDAPDKKVTITFWHGWSAESETNAVKDLVAKFNVTHPNIKVKIVSNVTDDKITQGIRSGKGPDVVSSFTTDNVGQFCSSGSWTDLAPWLTQSNIDVNTTFPKPVLDYTQFQGKRCSLPLLADSYGLYYNKDMFAAAGITAPPRTLTELTEVSKKLNQLNGDGSFKVAGFVPTFHAYEFTPGHTLAQFGPTYQTPDGKSNLGKDPMVPQFLEWQKKFVESQGGLDKLEKFRSTFGQEFSAENPFQTGKIAMTMDGEWRTAMLKEQAPDLNYGTAPFPVPDDQVDKYGRSYLAGTVIGIGKGSHHQRAAWEFVKFVTTDTDALNSFAGAIHNVPSTNAALAASPLANDEHFKPFIDAFKHPASNTTPASPNGGKYQVTFQEFAYKWEAGQVSDPSKGLTELDHQIDTDAAQVK
ncbi:ABC transporter substrate-binding protein [Streptomyces sp. SID3343]|uniref:ABC transporter substrate-binding protein n=1 Tax=Streptomyces sp. SID3343 TaxID=2690260 RepID=UPI0031F7C613